MASMDKNYKTDDYAKRKEADDKRRYINQTPDTGTPNTEKYKISNLTYPMDVTSLNSPHYVSFFINIRGKSKFNSENRFKEQAISKPVGANLTSDEIGRGINLSAAGAGAALGVGAVKKLAGIKAEQKIKSAGGSQDQIDLAGKNAKATGRSQVLGAAGGAAAGFGISWLAQQTNLLKPDQSFRISDVITLAVQEAPAVAYGAKYSETELGVVFGAMAKTAGMVEQERAAATLSEAGALGIGKMAGGALGAIAPSVANSMSGAFQAMTKMTTNPFREMLFQQVEYRSFKFNYRFLPKNAAEVDHIKKIIDLFKFHMHPELSSGNLFFIYPAEFQIMYYFKGKENTYFHKIAPSALTNLNVTYGSGPGMSSFHDGTPTEVNISLDFTELEIMTKERIQLGY